MGGAQGRAGQGFPGIIKSTFILVFVKVFPRILVFFLFSLDNFTTIHESRDQFVRTIRSERSQVLDYDAQFPYIYINSPPIFSRD